MYFANYLLDIFYSISKATYCKDSSIAPKYSFLTDR